MSNHLRMTNSFFRLDTNWLPIRLDTKWLLIGEYWRQWCCPWLNLKLFKGRHRNSNMEFLNIAQIFEHCPNFFEHRSKDLWFKGALPVPCALPLQFRPKKIFFSTFFCFFIITTIFNAQKRFLKNSPHDFQIKGLLNNVKKNCTFLTWRLP